MAEKEDCEILAAMIAALEELERLCRRASANFRQELQQASGLSANRLQTAREALKGLQMPNEEGKLFATLPESKQAATNICPECAGTLEISTTLEPASQRGYVMVITHSRCRTCAYHDQDSVSLPTEIALQQQNLEALLKGE